jgi:hypothetical protein
VKSPNIYAFFMAPADQPLLVLRSMGLPGILIGIFLVVLLVILALLTNPPSSWVGRDRQKPKK